jgi:predicted Rossmann fold flavoprotein
LGVDIQSVAYADSGFSLAASTGVYQAASLVLATGGPSIPKMGATGFAYDLARQFGLNVIMPRPALVPLTFTDATRDWTQGLSGVAVDPATVQAQNGRRFREAVLFTHRGLSGPAILQISSYWREGEDLILNFLPDVDAFDWLKAARQGTPKQKIDTVLAGVVPARLAASLAARAGCGEKRMADLPDITLRTLAGFLNSYRLRPNGSEGFRTAEVTLGGVDTDALSSRDFGVKTVPGLYIIGEALDVTGHLGGHNFQWAWSSGYCAGQAA